MKLEPNFAPPTKAALARKKALAKKVGSWKLHENDTRKYLKD